LTLWGAIEKGKNRALKEDLGKLEEQKQEVQIKFTREIEDLKKNNVLEVELRKHKYQEKKNQFAKFFTLLDEFNNKSTEIFMERFTPIFSRLMESSLVNDENNQSEARTEFNHGMMGLINELNQEYLKLTTETNSIRLISSAELDTLLDQLTKKVFEATDTTQNMMKLMASQSFWEDQSILEPLKQKAENQGNEVLIIRGELRKQMKLELDQI